MVSLPASKTTIYGTLDGIHYLETQRQIPYHNNTLRYLSLKHYAIIHS